MCVCLGEQAGRNHHTCFRGVCAYREAACPSRCGFRSLGCTDSSFHAVCSQMSNLMNQARLKVLRARDDLITVSNQPRSLQNRSVYLRVTVWLTEEADGVRSARPARHYSRYGGRSTLGRSSSWALGDRTARPGGPAQWGRGLRAGENGALVWLWSQESWSETVAIRKPWQFPFFSAGTVINEVPG